MNRRNVLSWFAALPFVGLVKNVFGLTKEKPTIKINIYDLSIVENKWLERGMLNGLSGEKATKVAILLENQERYCIGLSDANEFILRFIPSRAPKEKWAVKNWKRISIPLIRRIASKCDFDVAEYDAPYVENQIYQCGEFNAKISDFINNFQYSLDKEMAIADEIADNAVKVIQDMQKRCADEGLSNCRISFIAANSKDINNAIIWGSAFKTKKT